MLQGWRQDLRYGVRALARGPLFAATAVISLAIGIGANTAIFSVASGLLLRPRPGIVDPARVVDVGRADERGRGFDNMSYPNYRDLRDRNGALSGLAAHSLEPRPYGMRVGAGEAERVFGMTVSANYFSVLGTRAAAGRLFLPDEDRVPGASQVVMLSHDFWARRFGADPSVVGSTISLNGHPVTVVGVAERGFTGTSVVGGDVYVPMGVAATEIGMLNARYAVWLQAVGRLEPGVTIEQARAKLAAVGAQLAREYPQDNHGFGIAVEPTGPIPVEARRPIAAFVGVLMAVVALVLMIACVNVTGMMLARAATRRREIAVRVALGAARGRLVRQLVTEGLVLYSVAAVAGVVLSRWMVAAMERFRPPVPIPVDLDFHADGRVLAFTIVLSLATGLLSALVPALPASKPDVVSALKGEASAVGARLRKLRLRGGLVVTQVALSMLLLIVAGLFLRALAKANSIDAGFDPKGVEVAALDLGLGSLTEPQAKALVRELQTRAAALPGVESAAMAAMLPLGGGGLGFGPIAVQGREAPRNPDGSAGSFYADWNIVTPGYFKLMRMPLVKGRDFTDADGAGAPGVVIVNEAAARAWWGGEEALGKQIVVEDRPMTVVGIARDGKYRSLGEGPRPFAIAPYAQRYLTRAQLLVRSAGGGEELRHAAELRRLVRELAPELPVVDAQMLSAYVAAGLMPQRLALWVSGSFGAVGLLLAILGVYGVTAFAAARRTREFGVRVALGATRGDVTRLVLREGMVLSAAGIGVGTLAALAATRVLGSFLFGVAPADPPTFLAAGLLFTAVTLAASYVPARRAARVDAMVALRSE
ncbi:MAG TPA: ABC transporter permease [Gemmatimonadaceae bacterium]|nr:ABC transporter permease [Gemmatimonadaceae bacterium]